MECTRWLIRYSYSCLQSLVLLTTISEHSFCYNDRKPTVEFTVNIKKIGKRDGESSGVNILQNLISAPCQWWCATKQPFPVEGEEQTTVTGVTRGGTDHRYRSYKGRNRPPLQALQGEEQTTVTGVTGGGTDHRYRRYKGRNRPPLQELQGEEQTTVTGVAGGGKDNRYNAYRGRTDHRYRSYRGRNRPLLQELQGEDKTNVSRATGKGTDHRYKGCVGPYNRYKGGRGSGYL